MGFDWTKAYIEENPGLVPTDENHPRCHVGGAEGRSQESRARQGHGRHVHEQSGAGSRPALRRSCGLAEPVRTRSRAARSRRRTGCRNSTSSSRTVRRSSSTSVRTRRSWTRSPHVETPAAGEWRRPARVSASSTSSARPPPAGSATATTRASCSSSTTRCAACRCSRCRSHSTPRRPRCSRSSSSSASTGSRRCRRPRRSPPQPSGRSAGVVFAWIFSAHQLGAATAAWGAGLGRTATGDHTLAFLVAGVLGVLAAVAVPLIRSRQPAPALS